MNVETFFEKFEALVDAPDAIAKMRKLVLSLAIQGRLVPQNSKDAPAQTLLDQIAAHKALLAKQGKLRGETDVSRMEDDDGEFDSPPGWVWVRFGEIMVNRDGERIPVSKEERANKAKTYEYYGASGVIDMIDGYLFDKPLLLIGEDGANLINRSTPIAFIARGKYWVNNHAHVLDGISEDFLEFIAIHINAINLERYITGSAQPKMNQAKMNSIPIALPPLAEQKRIVAKVDDLMALCDRLEAQQAEREARHTPLARAALARFAKTPTPANLEYLFHSAYDVAPAELRQSILTLAVQGLLVEQRKAEGSVKQTEPPVDGRFDVPRTWAWTRFEDVGEQRLGKMLDHGSNRGSLKPYLRNTNVQWMRFALDDIKQIALADDELAEFRLRPGDLLICEGGEPGRCAIWTDPKREMYFQKAIHRVRPRADILPEYLALNLRVDASNGVLAGYFTGATIKHFTGRSLREYTIPLPPLAEQRRIVAKVSQLMALVDQLEAQRAAAHDTGERLMNAIVAELTAAG